jgi:hypothetical protein
MPRGVHAPGLTGIMLAGLSAAIIACGRAPMSGDPASVQSATRELPASDSKTAAASRARLDQSLRQGMSMDEAFAAIGARGTAGGPCSLLWSTSRVISDEYPGMAIDLCFDYEAPGVSRLSSWELQEREAVDYFLPIPNNGRQQ